MEERHLDPFERGSPSNLKGDVTFKEGGGDIVFHESLGENKGRG